MAFCCCHLTSRFSTTRFKSLKSKSKYQTKFKFQQITSSYMEPIKVLITGAAGQIGYSLIPLVAQGYVFGPNQPIIFHLLDIPVMKTALEGVIMEIEDSNWPLVNGLFPYVEEEPAFKDIDFAFLVGSMPRREGMERKDLLAANVKIFKSQGQALAKWAKPSVKVLVVGNPANTNAYIAAKYAAPVLKANQFTAMTRLDQSRAKFQLAKKHNIKDVNAIENVFIWGNHSSTQFPDVAHATYKGKKLPFEKYDEEMISVIQKRGAAVIAARKLSSAASAAKAAADHMKDLFVGTSSPVSMAVLSQGQYSQPKDIFISFPCLINPETKELKVDESFKSLNDFALEQIRISVKELVEERDEALSVCEQK